MFFLEQYLFRRILSRDALRGHFFLDEIPPQTQVFIHHHVRFSVVQPPLTPHSQGGSHHPPRSCLHVETTPLRRRFLSTNDFLSTRLWRRPRGPPTVKEDAPDDLKFPGVPTVFFGSSPMTGAPFAFFSYIPLLQASSSRVRFPRIWKSPQATKP